MITSTIFFISIYIYIHLLHLSQFYRCRKVYGIEEKLCFILQIESFSLRDTNKTIDLYA